MNMMTVQISFAFVMLVLTGIGFFCAMKLSGKHPMWVRLVVLYPALAALCTLSAMMQGHYVAYKQDIVMAFGLGLLYALVASRFTKKPWLDLRVLKKA